MPQPLQLLLAEDNPLDAELVIRELRRAGFEPEWERVDTEAAYVDRLRAGLDLVISDYEMPQFDGLQALALLKASGLEVPFILVSGTIGEELAVTAMRQGATDYLIKDRLTRLGPAVDHALNEMRLRREKRRADELVAENFAKMAAAQEELQWKNALLEAQVNATIDGVLVIDPQGRKILQNQRVVEMFDIPPSYAADSNDERQLEWVTQRVKDLGPFLRNIAHLKSHPNETSRDEIELKNGLVLDRYSSPVVGKDGKHYGRLWTFRDITERKRADQVLRASEARFRQLIENATDIIAVVDANGLLQFQSPSAYRVLGYEPEDLIGRPIMEFIHPEDHGLAKQGLQRALSGTVVPVPVDYRIRHRDGTWRIFQSIGRGMTDGQGVKSVVVNSRDITETRRLEEQFRESQKMEAIGTLAGGIAHDFNNILTGIIGYTEFAKMEMAANPAIAEELEAVLHAARRAAALVRQILAFSRREAHQRQVLQLRHIVQEVFKLLRATIPATIDFTLTLAGDTPSVLADATQIHQVIMNLGTNAEHAMRGRPGRLSVTLQRCELDAKLAAAHAGLRPGTYALLTVADTGCGMDAATMARIFEPFFTTKPVGEGTGLGLAAVHGIMQSHDGVVAVESQPGAGTTFRLYFPAHADETERASATEGEIPRGQGERILYLDDEPPLARLGQKILERLGYAVEVHTLPGQALQALRTNPGGFRLMITDQMMPGMTGTELVQRVRLIRPDLPVILTTGYTATLTAEVIESLGINQLLPKPLSIESLGVAVARVLHETA